MKITLLLAAIIILFSACAIDHPSPISGVPRSLNESTFFENVNASAVPEENLPISVPVLHRVENSIRATYEPEGIYLGAWLSANTPKRDFIAQAGRNHAVFVHEMHADDEIPVMWILQCIAALATPLFVIHPPLCEDAPAGEWITYLAYRLGTFNLPMFIAFYPTGLGEGHDLNPQEYSAIFRFSRAIFSLHAPQATFVWYTPSLDSTTRNPFFPGHDVVDWVAVSLFGEEQLGAFESFYHRFRSHHPMMVLPLGVSHFSRQNHTYRVPEAVGEIGRVYQALSGFPRVGLVVYGDAFGLPRTGMDDFSIFIEEDLMTAYRSAVTGEHFLTALERSPSTTASWSRDSRFAYLYEGRIYIDVETLADLSIPAPRGAVVINERNFIDAARLSGFGIYFCWDRNVVFIGS